MKKRLLAMLLALVLVFSLVPGVAIAEGEEHIHCPCGKETTEGTVCADCGEKAVAWTATATMPTTSGNYYLTADVNAGAQFLNDVNISLCLHGQTVKSAAGKKFIYLNKNVTYTIADCTASYAEDGTYTAGCFTGVTGVDTYGSTMRTNAGCVLNLYDGKITGNTAKDSGILYVDAGGTFNMYGGEISGNTCQRGTVFGVSNVTNKPVIRILGGTITGNNSTGTAPLNGGGGICAFNPVIVGGDAKIYGNTAKSGPADLYLRNDGTFAGKLIISDEKPLQTGAKISFGLGTAEADPTNMTAISGMPATWDKSWISYDGKAVCYSDGKFYLENAFDGAHVHCLCGAETAIDATCAACGSKAVVWTATTTLPKTTGYYYLSGDVSTGAIIPDANANVNICLHGNDITSTAGKKIWYLNKGATVTVTDCADAHGSITGCKNEPAVQVDVGATFQMYGGKITGVTTTGEGIILLAKGNTTTVGGTFIMYGGEISGNTCKRGTIMMANATGANKSAVVRILGGTITGNHATGTSTTTGGGAGILAMGPVEVGGNAKIYGNTAAAGPADVYLRNDQRAELLVSSDKPLTGDAKIMCGLYNQEADLADLQYVSGEPSVWNTAWITYEGEPLRYEEGKFTIAVQIVYSEHDHDGKTWISVTDESGMLPEADGYYVLDGDVTLPKELQITKDQHVVLCLNGHSLTAAPGGRHFNVYAGGTLTICDCTATTKDGVYTAGSITGANAPFGGGSIRLSAGAVVNLYDGKITGNHTEGEGGAFYLEGCTAAVKTPAVLNMYGGEISDNTTDKGFGGAIRFAGVAEGLSAATFHMEGGTMKNNESSNYGGAIHAPSYATIELLGGVIENNYAGAGGGGVSINGKTTVTLDGTVIRNNSAPKWGGGVYIKGGATMNMLSGEISGNSAKIGAGVLLENEGTTLNLKDGKISGNKVGTAGGGGVYVGVNCVMTMDGGEICNNTSQAGGAGVMCVTGTFTMNGGEICGNASTKGGAGVTCNSKATMVMNGGQICHNEAKSWGSGLIVSESSFTMNGGKITQNYTHQSAAGIYAWHGTLVLNKGSIHDNLAQNEAGGIRLSGSTMELNGAWITSNRTIEGNGGGVLAEQGSRKVDGKTVRTPSRIVMTGGSVSYNTAGKATGGVLIMHKGSSMEMYGGKINNNHANRFACAVYAGKGSSFSMHGGEVANNTLDDKGVTGVFHDGSTGNHTGGDIYGNVSPGSGGGFAVSGVTGEVYAKNLKIHDNTAKVAAGVLTQSTGTLHMENCEIYNNTATMSGAAAYMYNYSTMTMKNCKVYNNEAKVDGGGIWMWATTHLFLDDCEIYDNRTMEGNGGGIWTRGDTVTLRNTTIRNNTAVGSGGGLFAGMMGSATRGEMVEYIRTENTIIENNTAGKQGGAIYLTVGSKAKLYDTKLVNNKAAAEGGALWAKEDLTMRSVTATGNQSGGAGYAVYLDDSDFDGHSYFAGQMKMSGNMQIHDNPGGDLYLGEKVPVVIDEALTEGARMELTMHSGLLTQWMWGEYNYEGGNLVYTVTAGNRSVTEPEAAPQEETPVEDPTEESTDAPTEAPTEPGQKESNGNGGLVIGIVAIVAVIAIAALIIILLAKKKKSDK